MWGSTFLSILCRNSQQVGEVFYISTHLQYVHQPQASWLFLVPMKASSKCEMCEMHRNPLTPSIVSTKHIAIYSTRGTAYNLFSLKDKVRKEVGRADKRQACNWCPYAVNVFWDTYRDNTKCKIESTEVEH